MRIRLGFVANSSSSDYIYDNKKKSWINRDRYNSWPEESFDKYPPEPQDQPIECENDEEERRRDE